MTDLVIITIVAKSMVPYKQLHQLIEGVLEESCPYLKVSSLETEEAGK